MTKYFNFLPAILVVLTCGLTGCKKDNNITTSTGSISGTITPAASAAGITATNLQSNRVYSATADAATGVFKIADVDTGSYKISFTGTAKFLEPRDVNTAVVAGQNKDLGNIVFQSASITGTTSPAGAVIYISINAQNGTPYGVLLNAATGNFKTGTLPSGDYNLSFITASGYRSPFSLPVKVTLATGQSIDMGTIVMLPHKLSGAPFTTQTFGASFSAPNLTITSASGNIDNGSRKDFKIIMDNITAPGTYDCKNTTTSNISYSSKNSSLSPLITWSTMNTGGSGTVVVTSIDPVKKEITGTFKATLINALNANVVIDNGSFDFVYQ